MAKTITVSITDKQDKLKKGLKAHVVLSQEIGKLIEQLAKEYGVK
jgi:hypothetical protein